jgi:uncharacterized protein YdhG (YjbR/CyaY superfamily)
MSKQKFEKIYSNFPNVQKNALLETIKTAETIVPHSKRSIAWAMPTLVIGKDYLCHVQGFKNHNSFFPSSGNITKLFESELNTFKVSNGTIQFDKDVPFPKLLLKKILLARIDEINKTYPKKSGEFIEYYKNGGIKSKGHYKDSKMDGYWEFYRLDGSLMRTGTLLKGKQNGEWATYDKLGKLIKKTFFKQI